MAKSRAVSPASPSPLDRSSSRPAADHLPPRPSRSLAKKPTSRAEGIVCKKRKRSTEVRERKDSNDGDRMCLAQRLRHDDDTFIGDRHARSGLWRAPSYRKEQRRSSSPAPNNHKDSKGPSLHIVKSSDRRTSDDKGKEKTSLLSLNNRCTGSVNARHDVQNPSSHGVPSVQSVDRFLDSIDLSITPSYNPALTKSKVPATPIQQVLPPTPVSIAPTSSSLSLPGSSTVELRPIPFTFGPEKLSLLHHGHPLSYDLNLLPDDPVGPITLLGATHSEPGSYLVAAAHYRRTGRSRAACKVIRALLGKHAPATLAGGDFSGENKENGKFITLNFSSIMLGTDSSQRSLPSGFFITSEISHTFRIHTHRRQHHSSRSRCLAICHSRSRSLSARHKPRMFLSRREDCICYHCSRTIPHNIRNEKQHPCFRVRKC
jgi:hypothetical protein